MTSTPKRRWLALKTALIVWLSLIALSYAFGAFASLFTGQAQELPKWNGWDYLFFCAKEFAMTGLVLTTPIAIVVFIVTWIIRQPDQPPPI